MRPLFFDPGMGTTLGHLASIHAMESRAGVRMPEDIAEVTREFFLFGAEQDALCDAITCDPAWDAVQRSLQDDASGEQGRAYAGE